MIRRRLCSYTAMYIAGIAAGYFLFEMTRAIEAAGFMAACAFADGRISGLHCRAGGADQAGILKRSLKKEKIILAAMLFAGFLMFSLRFAAFEAQAGRIISLDEDNECVITGKIRSAKTADGRLDIVLDGCETDPSSDLKMPRVAVYYYDDGYEESSEESENELEGLACEILGERIKACGSFKEIMPADDPGCFDQRLYMRAKGISVSFTAYSVELTGKERGVMSGLRRYLYRIREDFIGRFEEEEAGFIRGVVFGDKSGIDEDTVKEFNINSTGHILAVSGLHVGFLYGLLRALTGRRRTGVISAAVIAVLLLYGEMTQWSAATLRASVVMGISLISLHVRRPFDLLTSVSLAALLMLIWQPYQLFDAGFRMSFLAMAGIAFFTKPISSVLGSTLGAMLAVQIGLIPVTAYTFYRVNLLSLFINIPIILLASVLVPVCLIMLVILMLTGAAPSPGISLIELTSFAVIRINHLLSFGGAYSYRPAGVSAASAAVFYIAAFALSSEWTRVMIIRRDKKALIKAGMLLLMPVMMLSVCMYDRFDDDEIIFVSVGQGDCTHIRIRENSMLHPGYKSKDVLIDGGGRDKYDMAERVLIPYLLHSGAQRADLALVTHLHMDHFKGICELCRDFPVGAVGIPSDYKNEADPLSLYDHEKETARPDADIVYIGPDTRIELGSDIFIENIWPAEPAEEGISASDPNEHNTVYMIHYKGVKIMVTGDLLEEDELEMVEHYREADKGKESSTLKCDILKVAHHGSKSSSCEAFLDAADPDIAVIQAGRNNFYGHPHQQTLDRLQERGIKIMRTDISGAIGIDIRKGKLLADTFRRYQ